MYCVSFFLPFISLQSQGSDTDLRKELEELRTSLAMANADREHVLKDEEARELQMESMKVQLQQAEESKHVFEQTLQSKMSALRALEELRSSHEIKLSELQTSNDGLGQTLQSKISALRALEELRTTHDEQRQQMLQQIKHVQDTGNAQLLEAEENLLVQKQDHAGMFFLYSFLYSFCWFFCWFFLSALANRSTFFIYLNRQLLFICVMFD